VDLNEKLLNVRYATRLLASYYRRLMTVLGVVDRELVTASHARLRFVRWDPTHHEAIGKQTAAPFGRWGWDFLPLMDASFCWSTDGRTAPTGPGSAAVFVWHQSDTGYASGEGEPDPTAFLPAEEADTELMVYAYALVSGGCAAPWSAIDERFDAEHDMGFDFGEPRAVPTDGLTGVEPGTVVRYVGWSVRLADLGSEADVEARVLAPLRERLERLLTP
jgi:hypothetical protein